MRNGRVFVFVLTATLAWFAAIAPSFAGDNLKLASWNIRDISDNSRSDAELGIIALILFRYDLIAVQEVHDLEVIQRLQAILQKDFQASYEIEVSNSIGSGGQMERYAFLWRKDRVMIIGAPWVYADPGDKLVREPFCARFKGGNPTDGPDFALCTVHVLWGNGAADRRPELSALDDVYLSVREAYPEEKDVLICGDFNFPPDDAGWDELKSKDGFRAAIFPPAKTTIGDKSLYDNFWWPVSASEVIVPDTPVFEFDGILYPPNAGREASRLTSDHRPISIEIRTDLQDDD